MGRLRAYKQQVLPSERVAGEEGCKAKSHIVWYQSNIKYTSVSALSLQQLAFRVDF